MVIEDVFLPVVIRGWKSRFSCICKFSLIEVLPPDMEQGVTQCAIGVSGGRGFCMLIIFLLLTLIPISVSAADKWTRNQIAMQTVATTLIIIDWGQTLHVSENPDRYSERNPFFDEHPSRSQVNRYVATALIGQLLISHFLPSKLRNWWLAGIIFVEASAVTHNYSMGVRVNF